MIYAELFTLFWMEGREYCAHCAHYSSEGFGIIKLIAKL